jgi:hypothetical protein
MLALRENEEANINKQLATQGRLASVQQARSGVRGAAANAQLQDLNRGAIDAQRGLTRDLITENINQKGQALDRFGRLAGASDQFRQTGQSLNTDLLKGELGARSGALLGGIGTTTGLLGGYRAEDFQKQAFNKALKARKQSENKQLDFAREALDAQNRIFEGLNFG